MKLAILSLAVASAAAFTTSDSFRVSTKLNSGMDDLKAVAEKSNPVLKVCSLQEDSAYMSILVDTYLTLLFLLSVLRSLAVGFNDHLR